MQILLQGIIRVRFVQGQLRISDDQAEHVVVVVGHTAGQPADRLHLLRLHQLCLQLFSLLFSRFAFGDVPYKDQTPVFTMINDRLSGCFHPHRRSVQTKVFLFNQLLDRLMIFIQGLDAFSDLLVKIRVKSLHHRGPEQRLGIFGSEKFDRSGIEIRKAHFRLNENRFRGVLDHGAESKFAFTQSVLSFNAVYCRRRQVAHRCHQVDFFLFKTRL